MFCLMFATGGWVGGGRFLEATDAYPARPPRPFPSDTNFWGEAVKAGGGGSQDSRKGSELIGSSFCNKFIGGYSSPEESFSRGFCKFAIEDCCCCWWSSSYSTGILRWWGSSSLTTFKGWWWRCCCCCCWSCSSWPLFWGNTTATAGFRSFRFFM